MSLDPSKSPTSHPPRALDTMTHLYFSLIGALILHRFIQAQDALMQSMRGWSNLNAAARVLVENTAGTPDKLLTISTIASLINKDTAQISRLLKGKVGFVRVENQLGQFRGIYYDPAVFALSEENEYYPRHVGHFYSDAPPEGWIATYVKQEVISPRADVKKVIETKIEYRDPEIDPWLHKYVPDLSEYVVMPVKEVSMLIPVSLGNQISRALQPYQTILEDFNPKELEELRKIIADVAFRSTSLYYTVQQILNAKEVS